MLKVDKKICFIVQRYGLEVNGGAELLCRQIAERMTDRCSEEEIISGVQVHRFGVAHPRNRQMFDRINQKFYSGKLKTEEEGEWMEEQGPAVPELIQYLASHKSEYDVFIFFTYLYYTTAVFRS